MKKTLVAIAALSAMSAFAQSSVTMYGRVDTGVNQTVATAATGVTTKTNAIKYSGINSSLIGFKGTEDLGGGLKASFLVETGLTLGEKAADKLETTNTSNVTVFGDRGSYLELEGGFGKITAGTQNTGARDIFIAYDAGGAINVAGSLNSSTGADSGNPGAYVLSDAAAGINNGTGSHSPFATAIKYTAPTFKGLTVAGSFTKNHVNKSDTAVDTRTAQGYSYGGNYTNGPLSAGVSYANAVTVLSSTVDITSKTTAAGASYDLGMAKLYVAHFKLAQVNNVDGTLTNGTNVARKSTTYGVKAPLTPKVTAFASMGTGTLSFGSGAFERDLKGTQMGVNYDFSKRTAAKFAYGTTKSDASATTETKVKETAVALVHVF
jgi:general bacterial porin, GBP family